MENISIPNTQPEDSGFFRNIVDNASAGGIFVNRDRTIKYCNSAVRRIFGYPKKELIGKKTELLYGDRRLNPADSNEIYNQLERNGYHMGKAEGVSKDGKPLTLNLYTFIIKENSGAFIFIREDGEEAVESAVNWEFLLSDLLDNIPDMIYFKDTNARFIMVNKAHAEALNLTPKEILGKSDLDLFPKELGEKYLADDMKIIRIGEGVVGKIEKAPRPDGGVTYVSTTKIPRFDEDGRVAGIIGITRNITEQMIAEEELRAYKDHLEELVDERTKEIEDSRQEILKMYNIKSDFTAMVSHELRTPVAVVKEAVGLVEDGTAGQLNQKQKEFLGTALKNIDRLVRLINNVLDFSKLESKKMKFNTISGNLNEIIDQVTKSFEIVLEKKGLRLYVNLDPHLPLVKLDSDRIIQVLYNLMTNAIKFTKGGSIRIESRRSGNEVTVSVEDTGPGIKKEDLHRIFEKFEQVYSQAAGKTSGTGLGLAICKQIIEQSGGRIWVESDYGKGSKFSFALPIAKVK